MPLAKKENGKLYYIVCDHLGTPRELLTEDGQLVWAAEYTTWGSVRRLWQADNDDYDPTRGAFQGYDGNGNPVYGTRPSNSTQGNLALKPLDDPDPYFCPIRFQGQWADEETELYYNRFRYYDPLSAQYCSPDPIGLLGGLRSQGYVDSPNIWIDPFGLKDVTVWHLTDKAGYNSITSGKDITLKGSSALRGNGVFFTTKDPASFGKTLSPKLGIGANKTKYYIKTTVPESQLTRVGNNPYKVYSKSDVNLKDGTWEGGEFDRKTGTYTRKTGCCLK